MGKHLKQKPASERAAQRQKKTAARKQPARPYSPPRKTFLDMIAPGVMKFSPDMYIRDNLYCCVWALKEYPAATEDQAILRHLGEKCGVNLGVYIGNGEVIEAMGTKYGVVKTKLAGRGWTHWLQVPYISYD